MKLLVIERPQLKPRKPRVYEDFSQFITQEEKRRHIWNALSITTSEDFLKELYLNKKIDIELSKIYKNGVGSVVVKLEGIVYREINKKFPIHTLRENLRNTFLKGINNENI